MTIQKGQYKDLRAAGPDAFIEELLHRTSLDLAAHLRANAESLKHPVLLDVVVGRLETWTAPGLLLLGDPAHPMSPNGGQGINMALRDALVVANHLCPVLTRGAAAADIDAAARQVVEERIRISSRSRNISGNRPRPSCGRTVSCPAWRCGFSLSW
jgi:2-polyprenyl-6-methoxyphenol hydroxylase-like FAD-dependent oxidoreductase